MENDEHLAAIDRAVADFQAAKVLARGEQALFDWRATNYYRTRALPSGLPPAVDYPTFDSTPAKPAKPAAQETEGEGVQVVGSRPMTPCTTCEETVPVREAGLDWDGVTMCYVCEECWGEKGHWMGDVALPDWDDLGPIVGHENNYAKRSFYC